MVSNNNTITKTIKMEDLTIVTNYPLKQPNLYLGHIAIFNKAFINTLDKHKPVYYQCATKDKVYLLLSHTKIDDSWVKAYYVMQRSKKPTSLRLSARLLRKALRPKDKVTRYSLSEVNIDNKDIKAYELNLIDSL